MVLGVGIGALYEVALGVEGVMSDAASPMGVSTFLLDSYTRLVRDFLVLGLVVAATGSFGVSFMVCILFAAGATFILEAAAVFTHSGFASKGWPGIGAGLPSTKVM